MATSLPQDYQSQLDQNQRKQQLAQMLLQRSMAGMNRPTEMVGRVAVRNSPLAGIANALTGFAGFKADQDFTRQSGEIRAKYEADQAAELGRINGMSDPKAAIAAALVSKFPSVQAYGKDLQKRMEDRLGKWADIAKDVAPGAAAGAISSGEIPQGWTPPPIPEPSFGADPSGSNYAVTTNRKGEKELKYAPKANTVDIKLPGKEAELGLDLMKSGVEGWRKKADAATESLDAARSALDALQEGARAGGGEKAYQALRKAAQGMGIQVPETATTEQLQMALGKGVLAALASVRPASDKDIAFLQQIQGSIGTDPTALARMLAAAQAIAIRDIQQYKEYIGTQKENMVSPAAKGYLAGEGVGRNVPQQLPGSQSDALRTIQELRARGGDPTQYQIGNEQITPDMQFDIRGPFNPAGMPPQPAGMAAPLPVGPDGVVDFSKLSKEQKARILQMLGK